MKILIGGPCETGTMMGSYRAALSELGHDVRGLSVRGAAEESSSPWLGLQRVPLLNRLGAAQLAIEGNRVLAREAIRWRPDVLLTTGDDVLPGTISTIAGTTGSKAVMIYPDPLVHLQTSTVLALPLYDAVIYACGTFGLTYFNLLGARRSAYIPFGWDDRLHPRPRPGVEPGIRPKFDIVFVGNWRRDREEWLQHLNGFRVGVWGTNYWRWRTHKGSVARRSWQGATALGPTYVQTSRSGRITLNLVDMLNGPGLNMRAFEATGMGCFVLSTRTQALEELFVDDEHIAYFDSPAELREKVLYYLARPEERKRIASNAATLADSNTYRQRAVQLLDLLSGLKPHATPRAGPTASHATSPSGADQR